ncbi:hypothetical protein Taro_038841 [Colocasia esculenta]|uniref:Uncharacterized protein n=1 Tax=Colocasia esculenta TaxID=4460 RepID=A0A843W949_COLES|nr:hypothetical protein [Colocasia esculenta]
MFRPLLVSEPLVFSLFEEGMEIDDILCDFQAEAVPTKSAIYVWGYNQCGQTARKGNEGALRIPRRLPQKLFKCPRGAKLRWLDIACGREHTAAVASDGTLFTWGSNDFGQLGDGTEESRKHPKKVKLLQSEFVKSVACGAHCTAAIAEPRENDGTISTSRLWVWGQNQTLSFPASYLKCSNETLSTKPNSSFPSSLPRKPAFSLSLAAQMPIFEVGVLGPLASKAHGVSADSFKWGFPPAGSTTM